MMARPGPVEPKPSAGRGRRRTSCETCRLVKRKCEGGVPCDRYGALAHSVDLPSQESKQTGRRRAPSQYFQRRKQSRPMRQCGMVGAGAHKQA
jgi:hypothetical protein